VKEAGIENAVHELAKKNSIRDYFLLDIEFPYLYKAAETGERRIAIRYSEQECIETALSFKGKIDWVWIDTITRLPLNPHVVEELKGFKTAIVCPERWGRPYDIPQYIERMKSLNFFPDLVMASPPYIEIYEQSFLRS
jgi:hypothetical protein